MSNFYGLEVARKSLYATQKALEVTGHNIANVNTKGYTRQVVSLEAVQPLNASTAAENIGGGVEIISVEQIRNAYYDQTYQKQNSTLNELSTKSTAYTFIEDLLGEGSDSSILSQITRVFNAMDELSQNAGDNLLREQLKQEVITLTNTMNMTAGQLYAYQGEQNNRLVTIVDTINEKAAEICSLNEQIFNYELNGSTANDLRDKRSLLVDELSTYANVRTEETSSGEFRVLLNGMSLVNHVSASQIELINDKTNPVTGESYASPYWEGTNLKVSSTGGILKAVLDIRDGSTAETPGIAYYTQQLDNLAGSLIEQFNTVFSAGYTLPYEGIPSHNGVEFFDSSKLHAYDISLSDAVIENNSNIAASSEPVTETSNWSNNRILLELGELRDASSLLYGTIKIGNFESYMQGITSDIAIVTKYTSEQESSQEVMVSFITEQRSAISGVSLDEEAINMIKYEKSYQASAKLMSVIDEMLETIINM